MDWAILLQANGRRVERGRGRAALLVIVEFLEPPTLTVPTRSAWHSYGLRGVTRLTPIAAMAAALRLLGVAAARGKKSLAGECAVAAISAVHDVLARRRSLPIGPQSRFAAPTSGQAGLGRPRSARPRPGPS